MSLFVVVQGKGYRFDYILLVTKLVAAKQENPLLASSVEDKPKVCRTAQPFSQSHACLLASVHVEAQDRRGGGVRTRGR